MSSKEIIKAMLASMSDEELAECGLMRLPIDGDGVPLQPCFVCGREHPRCKVAFGGLMCEITCEGCGARVYRCTAHRASRLTTGVVPDAVDEATKAWNEGRLGAFSKEEP